MLTKKVLCPELEIAEGDSDKVREKEVFRPTLDPDFEEEDDYGDADHTIRRLRGRSGGGLYRIAERARVAARTVVEGVSLVVGNVFDFHLSDRLMELGEWGSIPENGEGQRTMVNQDWVSVRTSIEGRAPFYPESGAPDKKSGGEFQGHFLKEGPFLKEGTIEGGSANKSGGGQLRSMSGRGFVDASSPNARAIVCLTAGARPLPDVRVVQRRVRDARGAGKMRDRTVYGLRHEAARRAARNLYSQESITIIQRWRASSDLSGDDNTEGGGDDDENEYEDPHAYEDGAVAVDVARGIEIQLLTRATPRVNIWTRLGPVDGYNGNMESRTAKAALQKGYTR
ncbi:hypothetical protein DFH06DRAFT_1122412 [Mycena polygramma]|nr:hypothetical protein DFH06DRAFT_1122412 [Mycena polygramma]